MKVSKLGKIFSVWFTICTLAFLAIAPVSNYPVNAEGGGIALTGTFSSQSFEIPQGSSVNASNVTIVVFNNGNESIGFNMSSQCPPGVTIILSETNFEVAAGSHKSISVSSIDVTMDAAPGEYEISITAEAYKSGAEGIQLLGSVRQTADLKVTGESGVVSVQAVSPDEVPVPATIRLFKNIITQNSSQKFEFAFSETGTLEATVSPGSYIVEGYVGGQLLDDESFNIAAGETKTITLTVGTIYFQQFYVLEYFNTDSGALGYAEIQYTVMNVYEEVDDVSIVLEVTLNGEFLEQRVIDPPNTLTLDGAEGLYAYIPLDGWVSGAYGFKLFLKMGDDVYTYSTNMQVNVTGDAKDGGSNLPLIIGIVCAVIILLAIALYLIYRKRKAKRAQPKNKNKTKEESKPKQ
ncbi:MAG: hypothetical protein WC455_00625 [Dehalococcoidia bacterium]